MKNWKVLQIHPQTHLKFGLYEEDVKYPSAARYLILTTQSSSKFSCTKSNQIKIRPKSQLS